MAAWESFSAFSESLTERERDRLRQLIGTVRSDLLAARSEDARVRLVIDFLKEARENLRQGK